MDAATLKVVGKAMVLDASGAVIAVADLSEQLDCYSVAGGEFNLGKGGTAKKQISVASLTRPRAIVVRTDTSYWLEFTGMSGTPKVQCSGATMVTLPTNSGLTLFSVSQVSTSTSFPCSYMVVGEA